MPDQRRNAQEEASRRDGGTTQELEEPNKGVPFDGGEVHTESGLDTAANEQQTLGRE